MTGESNPRYTYPPRAVAGVVRDWLLARRRSFRDDARACIERLEPPLKVLGKENVPRSGPCVITFNHYYRPGFNAWWMALGITAVVPADIHWIMTGELTFPGKWYAPLGMAVSRFVLARAGRMYGFTTMPPMPPRPKDVEARAASVREALAFARQAREPILGVAPEGGDQLGGRLAMPASGAGRFGLLLGGLGLRFVPVGAYEAEGEFCLHFGPAYELIIPRGLSADEKDRQAARVMMGNIARLLPPHLRSEFG